MQPIQFHQLKELISQLSLFQFPIRLVSLVPSPGGARECKRPFPGLGGRGVQSMPNGWISQLILINHPETTVITYLLTNHRIVVMLSMFLKWVILSVL